MKPLLFALDPSHSLNSLLAQELGVSLSPVEMTEFEHGEHKIRPLISVRNQSVLVLYSLYGDHHHSTNDKLCRLFFFLGALKDAWATSVTVVAPYLCYSRKDRRTNPGDPVCTRYLAQILEALGTQRILTMDVHNPSAFENSFRCPNLNLDPCDLFVDHFCTRVGDQALAVVSPDSGGVKRADALRHKLEARLGRPVNKGFVEKIRQDHHVWGHTLVGDVADRTVLIVDDLIASGSTLVKAAEACKNNGANRVLTGAAHGVFSPNSNDILASATIDEIVITDSIPPDALHAPAVLEKLTVLSSATLWRQAMEQV